MQYSVVNLGKTITTPNFRLDAEFYRPFYLESEQLISSKNNDHLGNLISVLTDYHANGSYETLRGNVEILDSPDYALMIRTVDFERDDFENDVKYVSEHAYKFLKKTKVFGGEIIINKIGNAGKVYLVPPLDKKISLGMNQFMIRPRESLNNYFLYVFLVCKYGQLLLEQRITGAVPLSIDKESVRSVPVPILKKNFQEIIGKLVERYFTLSNQGKALYTQAEQLLLSELELLSWKQKHELAFVKNFSDTKQSDRFDAEFFQPKYEEIVDAVKKHKGGFDELGNLVKIKKSVEPGSEEYQENGIPFVRVSNLSKFELSDNNQQFISEEFYGELKIHQPKQGEILLSKDATPGMAYYLNEEPQKMIVSGGILRLKIDNKQVLPEYLTLVLNSVIVQKQIERDAGGSIINHWRPDQVKATLIPILKNEKQKEIKELVEKSFNDRKLSKSLLEIAKRGVEMAIEKDEQEAEKWINNEIEKLEK
jgi:restriction endonuclease S subunit